MTLSNMIQPSEKFQCREKIKQKCSKLVFGFHIIILQRIIASHEVPGIIFIKKCLINLSVVN